MPTLQLPDGRAVPVIDGMVIGRVAACHITLDDEKVSRKHARIVYREGVAEVEDLGSRNGVFLNGNRVLRRVLRDGDVLTVGRVELGFRDATPAAPAGVAPGEDLLADDDPVAEVDPAPPAPAPRRPVPAPRRPEPAPPAAPEPDPEVEVLEFVDEVIEVRRRPEPAARGRRSAPVESPRQRQGVLQFSPQARSGALAEDVGQLGGLRRLLVVLAAVGFAVGVGWVAMTLAS